jgi:peptide/nickel transport system ATP-binding protein
MAASRPTVAPLLAVEGLVVEARTEAGVARIVDGVGFELRRGEVLGLIGESGAGKSTIGLAAMGFARDGCRIAAGSVRFDGIELATAPEERRRALRGSRIAYVAQSAAAAFNPAHRLIEQCVEATLEHGLGDRAAAAAAAVALYRRLRLPNPDEIGFRYPHQVSGGQLQRAITAMAMVTRPDLIVFDEPTTALDVTTQIEVLAAIRDAVAGTGTAAIYISHDLALVAQMAHRIIVLRHGRMVEAAETRRMLAAPQEAYTQSLWAVRAFRAEAKAAPPAGARPLLEIEHVSAAYGAAPPVLRDVSLALLPGRTTAIVGESGSGKSTLARVITGLLPPRAGRITLDGAMLPADYRARSRALLGAIQMVSQMPDTALNPRQRVAEAIGRPLALHSGVSGRALDSEIDALMVAIELEPATYRSRRPGELSGGQKQRVAIARALAARPRLLICDEVTSALDQIVAEEMLKLLCRLQRERGLTLVFITHDLATVRAIADEVVVMKDGRVVAAGPKAAIFAPPHDPYTALLLASVPEMDPDWLDRVLAARRDAAAGMR